MTEQMTDYQRHRIAQTACQLLLAETAEERFEILNEGPVGEAPLRAIAAGLAKEHTQDDDCLMDSVGLHCLICGVLHGAPSGCCGGTAFHKDDCPEFHG